MITAGKAIGLPGAYFARLRTELLDAYSAGVEIDRLVSAASTSPDVEALETVVVVTTPSLLCNEVTAG